MATTTMIVMNLLLVHLILLSGMSETVRALLLWPLGKRPKIKGGASWWDVYGVDPNDTSLTMEDLFAHDRALAERIQRSWFPRTEQMRRNDVLAAAVNDWHDRTLQRLRAEQDKARAQAERQRQNEEAAQQRARANRGHAGAGHGKPGAASSGWWTVLGVARTTPWPEVKRAYRKLRSAHSAYLRGTATPEEAAVSHPAMLRLNEAFGAAQRETGNV